MFDPTVLENLKIAFENQLYDLDNIEGKIQITNREDLLDMAVMSRKFTLQFMLAGSGTVTGEVVLESSLDDLAAEILETPGSTPACTLLVRFYKQVRDWPEECRRIAQAVRSVWQPEMPPVQTLSIVYGEEPAVWQDVIELRFNRRINEDQIEDIPALIEHMIRSLEWLAAL